MNERLETEVLYTRAAQLNGEVEGCDEDGGDGGEGSIYKGKIERLNREVIYLKQRLQQQHEEDLDNMVVLKKQMDKKVSLY